MAVPTDSTVAGNLLFPLIMIVLTLAAVVVTVYHPIAWSDEEMRLAVGGPAVLGMLVVLGAIALGQRGRPGRRSARCSSTADPRLRARRPGGRSCTRRSRSAAATASGRWPGPEPGTADGSCRRAAQPPRAGCASAPARACRSSGWSSACSRSRSPSTSLLYLPWALIDNHQLFAGWPGRAHGPDADRPHGAMYRYHNDLTAAHAASSPWWAWPLNLKPVWFYQGSFAGSTAASIYDAGNMVIWWLGIPAMAFVAYQAFRRRSLALALILIAFLRQWISWARIDRAAFQYHYYTSLPFVVLALGYFMAELWHGASRRTWLLARVAAAVALMGPVILWLLRAAAVRDRGRGLGERGLAGLPRHPGQPRRDARALAWSWSAAHDAARADPLPRHASHDARPGAAGRSADGLRARRRRRRSLGGVLLVRSPRLLPPTDAPCSTSRTSCPSRSPCSSRSRCCSSRSRSLTARDARRFVLGSSRRPGSGSSLLYPNISALPLPTTLVNAYQGILPTYLVPVPVRGEHRRARGARCSRTSRFAILLVFLVVACGVVAYSRAGLADRGCRGCGRAAATPPADRRARPATA